jgi:hypothetical protein
MFTQFNSISQASLQSFTQLFELNVFAAKTIVNQHSTLLNNVVDETLAYVLNTSPDDDFPSVLADHKKFSSSIYYETLDTWKQTTDTLAAVQTEVELIVKASYEQTSDEDDTKVVDQNEMEELLMEDL